jgi:phosphomannomutase
MADQPASRYFRFCPGEERILISDAVCRGRRRSSFPKCRGCQFNDDERAAVAAAQAESVVPTDDAIALRVVADSNNESDPPARSATPRTSMVRRGGGSDTPRRAATMAAADRGRGRLDGLFRDTDIRGRAVDGLTADAAWRIGLAGAQFLRSKLKGLDRADPRARSIVVGRDARPESAALTEALMAGIRAAGAAVYDIGAVDTPQVWFGVRRLGAGGGVAVTGGRSPAGWSGFKVCGLGGRDLSGSTGLLDICDIASRLPRHETGMTAEHFSVDLSEPYRADLVSHLSLPWARDITLVCDAGNGPAGAWAPALFEDVAHLNLIMLHDEATREFPRDPDPTARRALHDARRAVKRHGADLGVCFDADADACVFLDERGMVVRPDHAIALLARRTIERAGPKAIVFDRRCSRVVAEEIERAGGEPCAASSDSALVRKAMTENDAVLGALLSGQYFFADEGNCESAFRAMVEMLNLVAGSDRPLSERTRPLARYKNTGDKQVATGDSVAALTRIASEYAELVERLPDGLTIRDTDWWCHLRRTSRGESVSMTVEAMSAEVLKARSAELVAALRAGAASS